MSRVDQWCLGVRDLQTLYLKGILMTEGKELRLPFLTVASHHLLVAHQGFSQLVLNQALVLNQIFINSEYCTAASDAGINSHLSSPNQLPAQ